MASCNMCRNGRTALGRPCPNGCKEDTKEDPKVVAAALVWLRNHLDAGVDPAMKAKVLKRIDAVIEDQQISIEDMRAFRANYPS